MENPIRETLSRGEASVGSWLNLASPLAGEALASVGFPWLAVDAEHSPFDLDLITQTLRAIEARGSVPLVRTWDHDPVTVARLLDAGAYGIVFPHVSTPEQAEKLAKAMRYPPWGTRSVGSGRCNLISPDYRKTANGAVLCIPQIEDMEGIDNAEAIARVEGVDIGFLGPTDLAFAMGVEAGHPDHEDALQRFREGCRKADTPSGLPVQDASGARSRIEEGFRFIDLASDMRFLTTTAQSELREAVR
jgi:4-hydroxy-2-oxoheptanedioate aldolase